MLCCSCGSLSVLYVLHQRSAFSFLLTSYFNLGSLGAQNASCSAKCEVEIVEIVVEVLCLAIGARPLISLGIIVALPM
jgi:hypothetical protein